MKSSNRTIIEFILTALMFGLFWMFICDKTSECLLRVMSMQLFLIYFSFLRLNDAFYSLVDILIKGLTHAINTRKD